MPTANERRALWFLAIVALSGSVVRLVRARSPKSSDATADAGLQRQLNRVDSARARRSASKKATPERLRSPDTSDKPVLVDLDQASAAEIEALPGIGPALAARIVAYRDSAGRFGSAEGFCRIRGVGPALMTRLARHVVFSGVTAEKDDCKVTARPASKSHVTNRGKRR